MKKDTFGFVLGVAIGTIVGIMIRDKEREKLRTMVHRHAKKIADRTKKLYHEAEVPIKEELERVKNFVKKKAQKKA